MRRLEAWFVLLVTLALVWIPSNGASGSPRQNTDEAYVTLLYGDEFLLGVRVLGKSIRDTRSTKDMVVLISDGVSDYAMKLLEVNFLMPKRKKLISSVNEFLDFDSLLLFFSIVNRVDFSLCLMGELGNESFLLCLLDVKK